MKKHKWYWTLIAVSLVVLVGVITACGTGDKAAPPEPAEAVINSFTASPETINPGQAATLSWDVSGATTVDIQPVVGSVASSGTEQVSPTTTTTYTLTATNEGGSTTSSVTATVTSAVTGKPDLVITDIWLSGGHTVNYKIKNQGDADAESSQSYLYVDELEEANDYVEPLAAGQELTTKFSNYSWDFPLSGRGTPETEAIISGEAKNYHVQVCADGDDAVEESDEANNCSDQIWGVKSTYDFVEKAAKATWKNSSGELEWVTAPSSTKGAAFVGKVTLEDGEIYLNVLSTYPEQVADGWIQGKYGDFYTEENVTLVRDIVVPEKAKFTATVGFKDGATATDGVAVVLGYIGIDESLAFFEKMDVNYDGTLDIYEIDLSDLAGEKVYFVLRVEAKDSWEQDWLVWVEAKIVQD